MSTIERNKRIEAMAQALFNTIIADSHDCHWTEVSEALGLLMKTWTTTVINASDKPPAGIDQALRGQALFDAVAKVANDRFAEGYRRPVLVTFK